MNFRVVACEVFRRELEYLAPASPHRLEIRFLKIGEHARPAELRGKLQAEIDAAAGSGADAVLLAYALCGRATDGLRAGRVPLVLPRSHDCGGVLLGGRERFDEVFGAMPSMPFSSVGMAASGDYFFDGGELCDGDPRAHWTELYGEEEARYLWEAMHPRLDGEWMPVVFIADPEMPYAEALAACRERAERDGRQVVVERGSLRLLRRLLAGSWPAADFLTVRPGERIRMTGDGTEIMRTEPE